MRDLVAACLAGVLALTGSVSTQTPQPIIFDRFEYAVDRNVTDKATSFRAAGWSGVKSEPFQNGNGWLYTVTSIPGFSGPFPGGGSRVLAMEARPATEGFQTDFYLSLGGSENAVPGDVWFQFWLYPQNSGTQQSRWSNRNKFLYVTREGYPSHNHNWMLSDSNYTYNPLNSTPWGTPSSGQFVWQLASASGGSSLQYTGPGSDPSRTDIVGPQTVSEWMRPNRWTLVKMHFNTNGDQGVWEMWLRAYGTPTWTKVADWKGGVTPGFQWKIPSGQRGGHRELRMPTTVGNANPASPQYEYWLYMDDFAMATSEGALRVYSDTGVPPPPPPPPAGRIAKQDQAHRRQRRGTTSPRTDP